MLRLQELRSQPSNQQCADCSAPLTVAGRDQAHVVLPFGTFVCQACAQSHSTALSEPKAHSAHALGLTNSTLSPGTAVTASNPTAQNTQQAPSTFCAVKPVLDGNWTSAEVESLALIGGGGNDAINAWLERWLPGHWTRLPPDASPHERAKWAEAKYARTLFVLPDFSHQLACLQSPHDGAEVLIQLEKNAAQRAARFKARSNPAHAKRHLRASFVHRQPSGLLGEASKDGGSGIEDDSTTADEDGNRLVEHFVVVGVPAHPSLRQRQCRKPKGGTASAAAAVAVVATASASTISTSDKVNAKNKDENNEDNAFVPALELILEAQPEYESRHHNDGATSPQLLPTSIDAMLQPSPASHEGNGSGAGGDPVLALADAVAGVKQARFQAQILDAFPQPPGMTSNSNAEHPELPKRPPPPDHIAMFAFPETVGVKLLVTEEALFKQPAADSSSSLKDATWTDATAPGGGGGGVSSVPPPVLFSFVLTDEKSRRLYATALRMYEQVPLLGLADALEDVNEKDAASAQALQASEQAKATTAAAQEAEVAAAEAIAIANARAIMEAAAASESANTSSPSASVATSGGAPSSPHATTPTANSSSSISSESSSTSLEAAAAVAALELKAAARVKRYAAQANAATREALKIAQANSRQIQARKKLARQLRIIDHHNAHASYSHRNGCPVSAQNTDGNNGNGSTSSNGNNSSNGSSTGNSSGKLLRVWVPRCLLVVSHVAFFDPFRTFLKNLLLTSVALQYHTSATATADNASSGTENNNASECTPESGESDVLSTPASSTAANDLEVNRSLLLPIERYVANFCGEVPLPPRGQIEVVAALPHFPLAMMTPFKRESMTSGTTCNEVVPPPDQTPDAGLRTYPRLMSTAPATKRSSMPSTPPKVFSSSSFSMPQERGLTPPRSKSYSNPPSAANSTTTDPSSVGQQTSNKKKDTLPEQLMLKRSAPNELPTLACSLRPLLACLSVDNILIAFECLLTEEKVCLVSNHLSLLAPVAHALGALLFPFEWQGAFIPVMPASMLEVLDAPVPFFVGVHAESLAAAFPEPSADISTSESDPTAYLGPRRPREVVYIDLDRDVIDLGLDENTGEMRQPHHGASVAAAAGAGGGPLSSTNFRGALAGRSGGWGDGYWRAFDKLRAGLVKCLEPLRNEYLADGLRAQHEEAGRKHAKQSAKQGQTPPSSELQPPNIIHPKGTTSDDAKAKASPPIDSSNGGAALSLQSLSAERAGVVAAAAVADLAYPRNELRPWLQLPLFSSSSAPDSTLSVPAAAESPVASPSRKAPSTALPTPTKADAVDGSRLRVPPGDDESRHTTLGQPSSSSSSSSTVNESPTRALFSNSALENFNLVDDHYSAPLPEHTAEKETLEEQEYIFRGRSLHLPFNGEVDARNHFLRFFVFLFQGYDKHTPALRRLDALVKKRDMKASSTRRPMTDEEFEEARQIAIAQFDSEDFFEQDSFLRSAEHLKGLAHASTFALNRILESQMFERFLFRATEMPESSEVRFFDEKITEKQNRSLAFGTPKPTPFLDDRSCSQSIQLVAAPVPHGQGLQPQWWRQESLLHFRSSDYSRGSNPSGVLIKASLLFPAYLNSDLVQAPLIRPSLLPPLLPPSAGTTHLPSAAAPGGSGPISASSTATVGSEKRPQSVANVGDGPASGLRSSYSPPRSTSSVAVKLNKSMASSLLSRFSSTPSSHGPSTDQNNTKNSKALDSKIPTSTMPPVAIPDGVPRLATVVSAMNRFRAVHRGRRVRLHHLTVECSFKVQLWWRQRRAYLAVGRRRHAVKLLVRRGKKWLACLRYRRATVAATRLQARWRAYMCQQAYRWLRANCVVVQARTRGTLQRRREATESKMMLAATVQHLCGLWALTDVSLVHRSAFLCLFGHRPSWRLGVSCVQDEVHRLWQMLGVPAPSHQHQQPHLQQLSPSSTLPPARMFASDLAAAIAFLSPRLIAAGHPPSSSSSSSGFASIPSNLPHPPAAAVAGTEGRKTPDPRSRPSLLQRASDYSVVKSAPGRSSSVFQRRGSTLEQQHSSSSTRSSHLHPEAERQQVYEWLKAIQSDTNRNRHSSIDDGGSNSSRVLSRAATAPALLNPSVSLDVYFEAFNVGAKKRKQTLANALWRVPEDHAQSAALVLLALPAAQPYLHFLLPDRLFHAGPTDDSRKDLLDSPEASLRLPPVWAEAMKAGRALGLPHLEQRAAKNHASVACAAFHALVASQQRSSHHCAVPSHRGASLSSLLSARAAKRTSATREKSQSPLAVLFPPGARSMAVQGIGQAVPLGPPSFRPESPDSSR